MVLALRVLTHPAHRVDAGEETVELDRPAQRTVDALPSVEIGQCGVHLLIR